MSDLPAPPRGCPDSAVLAAYAEGTLDRQSRREVERHVADCPECPVVIGETVRFLRGTDDAESEADPPPRTQSWRLATAAAFAVLCMTGLVWQGVAKRDPLHRVKQIAAEAEVRTVEGRLTDFEHVPFSRPRSDRKPAPDFALRAEAERLTATDAADARLLHARGVALLLTGDIHAALQFLEAASRRDPSDPALQNDLAAAYVAAGRFPRALAAADAAIALFPSLGPGHFNRAVALEHLGRREDALRAYQRALELEPRSPWRGEIAVRMVRLQS